MKLKCAAIDDEPLALGLMESYILKTPFLELGYSSGSASAAFQHLKSEPVDLLFCDIQMPGLNGMELTRMLPAQTRVIFTTAFSSYALEGYKVNALDYLLKPISYEDFLSAAGKALQWYEVKHLADEAAQSSVTSSGPEHTQPLHGTPEAESIFIKTEYRLQQIPLKKLLYIEGLKDYVKIFTEDESHPILSLTSLKSLEAQLPSNRFVRVHRSFIVQASKIQSIENNRITINGQLIPISDSYRKTFFDFLSSHSLLL